MRAVLREHRGYVRALAFSADGKTLASGDSAGEWASLWDVRFGDRIRTAHVGMGEVVCLAFTPDGEGGWTVEGVADLLGYVTNPRGRKGSPAWAGRPSGAPSS